MIDFSDIEYRDGSLWRGDKPAGYGGGKMKYRMIRYKAKRYYEHRFVWEMHHGEIPEGMHIDHINRDRYDNRIENLRCVDHQTNQTNTLGRGYEITNNKYRPFVARAAHLNEIVYLGSYDNPIDARAAYLKFKESVI